MSFTRKPCRFPGGKIVMVVGLLVTSMLNPSIAAGQSPADADALYNEGIGLRAKGKHEQALDRFRRSLAIERRPQTYLALASSFNELGKEDEAIAALDAMFAEFGTIMKPLTRQKAEKALLVVEGKLGFGRLEITAKEKGIVLVDGKEVGTLPLASTLRIREGAHSVRITRGAAEPIVRDIVVTKGEKLLIDVPPLPIASPMVEPAPSPAPKIIEAPQPSSHKVVAAKPKPTAKPVAQPQSRPRIHVGGHAALLVGAEKTSTLELAPPTTCGVYCLPSLGVLVGARAGIPMRGQFVLEAGLEYMHAVSTLNVTWQQQNVSFAQGASDATLDLEHVFALDGALAHAAVGANVPLGKRVRLEARTGVGVFIGQSTETVSGQVQSPTTLLDLPEATERTATIVLPVVRARLGVSVGLGPLWVGIAAEGVVSLTKGPAMCTPELTANDLTLEASGRARVDEEACPDGSRSARPFERLLLVSPAVSVGGSF